MFRLIAYFFLGLLMALLVIGCAPGYYYPYPNAVTYPTPAWGPGVPYPPQCTPYHVGSPERLSCERGARQRLMEEQRRRENDAYRQGLGR